jgi:phage terminase large subunit-like protein
VLRALFALPPATDDADRYRAHTGRRRWPTTAAREAWLVVGRRGGKSRIAALVAVYLACFRDYRPGLAPGERATVMVIAADRRQARVVLRYIAGFFDSIPLLRPLVQRRTAEALHLTTRVTIEVHTASFRAVRGYTVAAAICDEIAFWRSEDSANPDVEILAALRPAMATVPGALLLCLSSPYARRGALWETYREHYGQEHDPVLVWQAPPPVS